MTHVTFSPDAWKHARMKATCLLQLLPICVCGHNTIMAKHDAINHGHCLPGMHYSFHIRGKPLSC